MKPFHSISLLLILSSCYPSPSEDALTCHSDSGVFFSGSNQCDNFKKHEEVMLNAYILNTPQWTLDQMHAAMNGFSVRVLPESELKHDAKGRAYFTDATIPNFMIWGETSCQDGTIRLADDNFKSGVLCHEFGHVFMGCGMNDHQLMASNGVDAAIRYVEENYQPTPTLTGATGSSGLYSDSNPVFLTLPDGRQLVGEWTK